MSIIGSVSRNALITVEQIRAVHRTAFGSSLTNIVAAFFLIVAFWGKISEVLLILCFFVICIAHIVRFLTARAFRRTSPGPASIVPWGVRTALAVGASGMVWGFAGFMLFTPDDVPAQSLLTMLLTGLTAGSIVTSTPYLPANYLYVSGMLIPLIVRTGMQWDPIHIITAILLTIYLGFVMYFSHKANRLLVDSLRMRYENIDLIQELRAQKETAEVARREAEAANRAKSHFLAAASHDLRQPMHALGLFAAALGEKIRYPEVRSIVNNINASVEALEGLFDELLDISQLDAGVIVPCVNNFPVQHLFDRIMTDFGPQARMRGLELCMVKSSVVIRSDCTLLERILRNLVLNAIRYTERGKVLVGVRRRQGSVMIEVWDTGLGIPKEQWEKVFEEFYQIGNHERDRNKGLGLGLAIVRRLTKLLDHWLELRSNLGKGSVFRVEVPIGKIIATDEPAVGESFEKRDQLSGKTIVLIDDERPVREGMRALLHEWGCLVITAGGIEELAELSSVPSLIIADYRLREGATGADAIRRLQTKYGSSIPGILITGDTAPDRIREARASGYQLLHKPVPPARLKIVMSYMLGG